MGQVLVVDPWLGGKGGSGTVSMTAVEAIQDEHEVTLLTAGTPTLERLNEFHGTTVSDVALQSSHLANLIATLVPASVETLRGRLLNRILSRHIDDSYDLILSGFNELSSPYPHVNYIHDPASLDTQPPDDTGWQTPISYLYRRACEFLEPADQTTDVVYLANSSWTARAASAYLGQEPSVMYPPVATDDFEPVPWEKRADRFVSIARVSPSKNLRRNVDILSELVARGHDLEYVIVGPIGGSVVTRPLKRYARTFRKTVRSHEFVHYEGEVSRERLTSLVSRSKYGLHGMDAEHFGIGVAELLAGGTIPFVPRSGGQQEIVGHCEDVLYDSRADAIESIERVLTEPATQRDIRRRLPDAAAQFDERRFKRSIRELVSRLLGGEDLPYCGDPEQSG